MTNRIHPATDFPFKPGEAVYLLPSNRKALAPPPRILAVVVYPGHFTTTIEHANGRHSGVSTSNLSYAGYCDSYAVPAILDSEWLVCPACGAAAIDRPPPDALIVPWFPTDSWITPMIMHRAFVHPDWSWRTAYEDRCETIARACKGMLARLGLDDSHLVARRLQPELLHAYDHRKAERLKFYAMLGLEAMFKNVFLDLLGEDDDPGAGPSRRLALPALAIVRSADESEPDGADELTAWLEQQFRKGCVTSGHTPRLGLSQARS